MYTPCYLFTVFFSLKEDGGDQESRMFPDDGKTDVITCSTLTQDFLIFATEVSGECRPINASVPIIFCRVVLCTISISKTGSM